MTHPTPSFSPEPTPDWSFTKTPWLIRRVLPPLVAAALVLFGSLPAVAFESEESPDSPREVLRNRRLEGIFDRVTIELANAGGNLTGAQIEVGVEVGGRVTLLGAVESDDARERAEYLARTQVGVKSVENRLRIDPKLAASTPQEDERRAQPISADDVGPSASAGLSADEALSRSVASAMAKALPFDARAEREDGQDWQVDGKGWRFDVVARDGHVRLVGDVQSLDAAELAAKQLERRPDVASLVLELESADASGFCDWLGF